MINQPAPFGLESVQEDDDETPRKGQIESNELALGQAKVRISNVIVEVDEDEKSSSKHVSGQQQLGANSGVI